jgi:ABC-2 type transport system permease protein
MPSILNHNIVGPAMRDDQTMPLPRPPRTYGPVNWLGAWTLYQKEIRRFLAVYFQTVLAPVVTTLLYLAVFGLALGRVAPKAGGVPFMEFLTPGLAMMAMMVNAFANTSSSLIISKVQGNIVDMLMPPLAPLEQTLAVALGGATRGLLVGLVVTLTIWIFEPLSFAHPGYVLYHAAMGSLMLSLLGMVAGIWADKFDHMAAVTNFVITPLSFLSGTFYSIDRLPHIARQIALVNPFFYMIDGFRYGFTGHADGPVGIGVAVMAAANLGLLALTWRMFATGYKLKA